MGVTSLGRHTRPGCNLGFYAVRSINQDSDLVLYTVCVVVYLTSGGCEGSGAERRSLKLCQECGSISWVGSRDFYAQIWASKRHRGHMG